MVLSLHSSNATVGQYIVFLTQIFNIAPEACKNKIKSRTTVGHANTLFPTHCVIKR